MYYNGVYHLFYQYNPGSVIPGNKSWAHSVSNDLINWLRLEPTLDRTKPYDSKGCWSGSVTILPDGRLAILYTGADGVKNQAQCIAFPSNDSDPYLREWTKPDSNPVIRPDGPGPNLREFSDPTTGWTGPDGQWRIAVGAELDGYGAALLYKSEDCVRWSRVDHPLYSYNSSTMWECPDFFVAAPNGAKHVLKVSLDSCDKYMIGVYDLERDRFVPDTVVDDRRLWQRIDYGNYYASKSFFDAKKGRRIIWGWANESDSLSDDVAKGWAGIQAIPRKIWLDSDGKQLLQWPVEEVESLRRNGIDHSVVESFGGGGRVCVMARVYPVALVDDSGTRMYVFNNGMSTVMVSQLKAWSMRRAQVNVKKG